MGIVDQIMAEGIRRRRVSQQSETLRSLLGSPGNPTPNSPLRPTGPTGIFTAPLENQAGLISDALLQGGQIQGSISTLQQLVSRREQIAQSESQFQQSFFQNQEQFDDRSAADLAEFEDEMLLKTAQRKEQSIEHLATVTKDKLGIKKGEQDLAFAIEDNERAKVAFGRIPTTEQEKFLGMSDTFHEVKDAHRDFQKAYAVNSRTGFFGQEELNQLRRKTNPSVGDMEKLNFWDTTVNRMNLFLGQQVSGQEISDNQRAEIAKLLPTVQDNAAEIDRKLNGWQNFWGKRLDRRMDIWIGQDRNVDVLGISGGFEADPLKFQPEAANGGLVPQHLLDQIITTPDN